ncbi:MAG TPA: J domain-containing protein [Kofleriaceae bacterium]|nr:J domain-containing protein [Kofleriaceae bacterium]
MASRTLHVRCGTWDQVEAFTTRKLRRGRLLSMKVPFAAMVGNSVTIGLELPNEVTIAIDGVIQKTAPVEGDASRTWIEIELIGFTDEVKARLRAQQDKRAEDEEPGTDPQIQSSPPARRSTSQVGDSDLPADERELFKHLTSELRRMRTAAVHDVLGVPRDAGPEMVRLGWKDLIRRIHPDLIARRNAPAITHLAEELTILANRAYDRLRAALVAEGRGTQVGPSLAAPAGWLVGFEDIQSDPANQPAPKKAPNRFERPPTPTPPPGPAPREPQTPIGQGQDFEVRARAQLAQNDPNSAREVLAAALVVYPRSKPLRSLYYVATALAALQDGELMLATSQLETALAHHEQCIEASRLLEHLRKHGKADPAVVARLFR